MLTLGLMEGLFLLMVIVLVFVGAAERGVPGHRILGPPALVLMAVAAWAMYDRQALRDVADVAGVASAGFFGFIVPLAFMRWAWIVGRPAAKAAPPVARAPRKRRVEPVGAEIPPERQYREVA